MELPVDSRYFIVYLPWICFMFRIPFVNDEEIAHISSQQSHRPLMHQSDGILLFLWSGLEFRIIVSSSIVLSFQANIIHKINQPLNKRRQKIENSLIHPNLLNEVSIIYNNNTKNRIQNVIFASAGHYRSIWSIDILSSCYKWKVDGH